MKIHIYNAQKEIPLNKKSISALVKAVLIDSRSSHSEVSIYFVGIRKISALHDQFFQDPSPTDCISFPIDETHLGEIFVCPKVALLYAEKAKCDPYREIALYIVHGLLHCLGYDDLDCNARRAMRKKEKHCMALINKMDLDLRPCDFS